jgi:ubiquinone/menaquinone biosynthesis C-methylase UbiE
MKLFRTSHRVDLSVAMSGVKLADRLLVIGCADPKLIARLAVKAGLTGRACAVDESAERVASAARVAEREGALIEAAEAPGWTVPYEAAAFDLVVVRDSASPVAAARARALAESLRVLRPGGRCLIIEGSRRSGMAGLFWRAPSAHGSPAATAARALAAARFVAVRTLAEREGLLFVEGVKPATART